MKSKIHEYQTKNNIAMKTIISIPGCAASSVLKSLQVNNVTCNYMGLDQSGRIIMEITYESTQMTLIKQLNEYMQNSEEVLAAMTAAVNEVIENRNTELFKSLDELKKKYTERNKTTQVISD